MCSELGPTEPCRSQKTESIYGKTLNENGNAKQLGIRSCYDDLLNNYILKNPFHFMNVSKALFTLDQCLSLAWIHTTSWYIIILFLCIQQRKLIANTSMYPNK